MNYHEALEFLNTSARFGDKPGLERITALLGEMGNPQNKLKFVHIAGTNGKGSTCAMTESILRAAGYKVGMYISPYLEDYRERIQVNRKMIPEDTLAALASEAAACVERLAAQSGERARKFEIETAIGMKYFADQQCDIAVLEVGLGGRLDATNVIERCETAAITSISFDHTRILGGTLEQITFEKCGILKPGCTAVSCAAQQNTVADIIRNRCAELDIPLTIPDERALTVGLSGLSGSEIVYRGEQYRVPFIGAHQIQNALTAIEIASALRERGWHIPQEAVRTGIASAKWNGRLEKLCDRPLVLIDGAHNQDAIAVLCGVIDSLLRGKRIITVMAMSEDKNHADCAPLLLKRSVHFIATRADGAPHPLPPEKLALSVAGKGIPVEVIPDVSSAVGRALSLAAPEDVVMICGSLYFLGDAKRALKTPSSQAPARTSY